jgi:hypothetical protein
MLYPFPDHFDDYGLVHAMSRLISIQTTDLDLDTQKQLAASIWIHVYDMISIHRRLYKTILTLAASQLVTRRCG